MTKEAKILLDHSAFANYLYKSTERTPLLHIALRAQNLAMVRLLVDGGAFVDAKDEAGMDAFKVCAAVGGGDFTKASSKYMIRKGKRQVAKQVSTKKSSSNSQDNIDKLDVTAS